MSESAARNEWEGRHRGREAGGTPEPFVAETLPILPRNGIALDVAAGGGRHCFALAQHGLKVIAIDYSQEAMGALGNAVQDRSATIWPVVADLDRFSVRAETFDLILNVNYLDRALVPRLIVALKPNGMLLADTFLVDQAEIGHPRNPKFLLEHYELRDLLKGLAIVRYREGLTIYADGTRAWRGSALAIKRDA